MTDSWGTPPPPNPDPWGRSSSHPRDPWGTAPPANPEPWNGVPQEIRLPAQLTPPSVVPTVLVTALAGLFGLIPASLHAARARSIGLPGAPYWRAFGITFAAMAVLGIGLAVAFSAAVLAMLSGGSSTPSPAGWSTPASTPSAPAPPDSATTRAPVTTYSPPPPSPTTRAVTTLPAGSWITVLESLPKNQRTEADASAVANSLSAPSAQVVVVDSDSVRGLTPGYWAAAVIGSSSRAEAANLCAGMGRPVGGTCYPRQVG